MKSPLELYIVYADADERLCRTLEKHLRVLEHQGLMVSWHRRCIRAGMNVSNAIDEHLDAGSVILLLISVDLVDAGYGDGIEIQRAMERHEGGEACVIPILLRPVVRWQEMPFGTLQPLPRNEKPVTTWSRQEDAFVEIARGIKEIIQEKATLTLHSSASSFPHVWNVPYPRNPVFTGREQILTNLAESFHGEEAIALSQPQAMSGLGGIGKTQIALEYAYQYCQNYQTVFWTQADTQEALVSGYVTLATLLNLPIKDEQDQQIIVQVVKQWLSIQTKWLLILDNADDLVMVREFLPATCRGHILLTTRAQAMGRLANRIEIEMMDGDTGALLLLRRAGLIASHVFLEATLSSNIEYAKEIVKELGGLPLALDQAGAYIEETACSLLGYLDLYRTRRTELLMRRGGLVADHPDSVATTWSLSFEKVEKKNPAAADLLRCCAYLAPDDIPDTLIITGAEYLGPLLQPLIGDPIAFNDIIGALRAYSLLHHDGGEKTINMHRLVQAVVQDALSCEDRKEWMRRVVFMIDISFPDTGHDHQRVACERWLPHALVSVRWIEQEHMMFPEAASLLNEAGYVLEKRGRYAEAERLLKQALENCEQRLEASPSSTAQSLNNLACLYRDQGKYIEAEPLYLRALEIREQQIVNFNILSKLESLIQLYEVPGTIEYELLLHLVSLRIRGQMLEWMPFALVSSLAISLNNLADLYRIQGKYEKAEPFYDRALMICELRLGEEHSYTAFVLNNLALLYGHQGKYQKAGALHVRALEIRKRVLGERHPEVAMSLNNLSIFNLEQRKYAEAELLSQRALEIRKEVLGERHPEVAMSLNNLAMIYHAQGKHTEGELLLMSALELCEQELSPMHPWMAASLSNLATFYKDQEKYSEAERLWERALTIVERSLGNVHPDMATILDNLGELYKVQKRYEEAEVFYVRALQIHEQIAGARHPSMVLYLDNLAECYSMQRKYSEAKPLLKRTLDIYEQTLGKEHPTTQSIRRQYTSLLRAKRRENKARALANHEEPLT